jgi:hypothetical protein
MAMEDKKHLFMFEYLVQLNVKLSQASITITQADRIRQ